MRHVRLLPPLLWTAVVLFASTDPFSAAHTGSILETLLRALGIHLVPHRFGVLHFLIRKGAHLTEYGILGGLWWHAMRGRAPWQRAFVAIAMVALTATTDEIHQSFVPSRGSSPYDVMLDIAGAALVVGGIRLRMLLSRSS